MTKQIKYVYASGNADFTRTGKIANVPVPLTDLKMVAEGTYSTLSDRTGIDFSVNKGHASEVRVHVSLADSDNLKVSGYEEYRKTASISPVRESISYDISDSTIKSKKTQLTLTATLYEITQFYFKATNGNHERTMTGSAQVVIEEIP